MNQNPQRREDIVSMKIVEKGEMLGARGFFLGEFNQFSAKSINVSQVAICKKEDFLEVISKYPTLGEKFQQRYQKREADRISQPSEPINKEAA